jgi:hypothetical protein
VSQGGNSHAPCSKHGCRLACGEDRGAWLWLCQG